MYLAKIAEYVPSIVSESQTGSWSRYITIATGFAGAAGIWYLWRRYHDRKLPPGPTGWPLIGASYLVRDETYLADLEALAKKYGDVFSIQMGGR